MADAAPAGPSGPRRPRLAPLIVSAPFGNYVQPPGATPTLGTFTAARRPGRIWRVLKTVRYHPSLGAWVNRIGLRNPGIDWLAARAASGRTRVGDKLISVHGFTPDDWRTLLDKTGGLRPAGVELNMSCPNVGEVAWPRDLFERAMAAGPPIVVKLPPVNYETMLEQALAAGVRAFHCCNTLPVPAGGLSGKPLKPVALQCVRDVRRRAGVAGPDLLIVGGGGITGPADVADYAAAGADRFAIGSKLMNPWYLASTAGMRPLLAAAAAHAGALG